MLIDVQDETLNIILNLCLFGMVAVAALSLIPQIARRRHWIAHLLPALAVAFYAAYEYAMPARINIRLDLIVVWPLVGLTILAWLARVLWRHWNARH